MVGPSRAELARRGEELAARHLERLGYRRVARNERTRWGELDLIVCDARTLVFVEVKTRRAPCPLPLEGVGPAKQAQVRALARAWLAAPGPRPVRDRLRFDAVGVVLDRAGELVRLDHVEGAF
ncbi:MAG: YraN family protein [Actinobacteria bacterium]|nr:MAG: YraN family protein [Actinomycetota bacterium]